MYLILHIGGNVSFAEDGYSVSESNGSIRICVSLDGTLARNLEVNISASPNTATAGEDFTFTDRTLQFTSSTSTVCSDLFLIADQRIETTESLSVNVQSTDEAAKILTPVVNVEIRDASELAVQFEQDSYEIFENETVVICIMSEVIIDRRIEFFLILNDTSKLRSHYTNS